jgi:Na+/proline symporter
MVVRLAVVFIVVFIVIYAFLFAMSKEEKHELYKLAGKSFAAAFIAIILVVAFSNAELLLGFLKGLR